MPQGAAKALPLLDQALAIEPTYALAHGFAAWAHQSLFVRGGRRTTKNRSAMPMRRSSTARATQWHSPWPDSPIGIVEHDRGLADEAFAQALALSRSCAFVYAFGSVSVAYGGDKARAIDWGEQALRLNPLDAMSCVPQGIIGFGNFLSGRYEQAVIAGRRAVEMNPGFSMLHGWLAAPLARLGRLDEAKAAATRLLSLNPHFTIRGWSAAVGIAPDIIDDVTDAMRMAGLPAQ